MKKLFAIIRNFIILMLILAISCLICIRIAGCKSFKIISNSMEPTLSVNDVVYVKPTYFEILEKGDIITFLGEENTPITHRIISIDKENRVVVTKGDNNEYEDINPVIEENIIGKMLFKIPKLGLIHKGAS